MQKARRPDLKIIVMSATLVPGPLHEFLKPCRMLESAGRTFPVDVRYQAPQKTKLGYDEAVWDQAARACETLLTSTVFDGDILVFMPGGYEIRKTIAALSGRGFARNYRILPLHGELPPQEQDAAVAPSKIAKRIRRITLAPCLEAACVGDFRGDRATFAIERRLPMTGANRTLARHAEALPRFGYARHRAESPVRKNAEPKHRTA